MDEQETNQEEKKEVTADDSGKGDKYETTPLIERARQEREKLDAANTKKEELLNREEEMMAKKTLGGDAEAGQETTKKEEETPAQYAERIMKNEEA